MYTIHSMVPDAFDSYARVFHPATLCGDEVRWAEVASANGRTMHGAAEWGQLTGSWRVKGQDGLWDHEPDTGPTPEPLAMRLATILTAHTRTPERCWFAVWEGWGGPAGSKMFEFREGTRAEERARIRAKHEEQERQILEWDSVVRGAPRFSMPDRGMHLLRGPLPEIGRLYDLHANPPSIWWPDDRAWCVGSDVDLMSTYLGATAATVEAVVGDPELEALAIPAGQGVTWEADTVNPSVGRAPF
jgi:hypothetical protein